MGPRATIRCIGAEQMTDDLSDIRTWIHAPEGLIIIGLTTFFVSITLFELSILPRILPVDRLERQIFSDHGGTQLLLEGAKYLCDVNGLHLVGFKFLFNDSIQSAARPLSHLDARALSRGVACWNFHKGDWDIKLSQPRR